MGPNLSSDQASTIAPLRETRLKLGTRPVTPQRIDVPTIEPPVWVPIAKPTRPAAVAAEGPALDPDEPSSVFQGLRVMPPNQTSPRARAPVDSFATSTAPASASRSTQWALAAKT